MIGKSLKGNFTLFYVDVESVFVVSVVNWSNKFLRVCFIDRVSWVLLLAQPCRCVRAPGCNVCKHLSQVKQILQQQNSGFSVNTEHTKSTASIDFDSPSALIGHSHKMCPIFPLRAHGCHYQWRHLPGVFSVKERKLSQSEWVVQPTKKKI